jgi:hypothetical protein
VEEEEEEEATTEALALDVSTRISSHVGTGYRQAFAPSSWTAIMSSLTREMIGFVVTAKSALKHLRVELPKW